MSPPASPLDGARPPRTALVVSIAAAAGLIAAVVLAWQAIDVPAAAAAAQHWRAEAPVQVALVTIFAVATWSCALPTTVPELAIGYVFGLWQGWAINFAAKFIASCVCYALGRTVLRRCLHRLWLSSGKQQVLLAFEDEVKEKPYYTAFLIRVAYCPMAVKNYGMALIGVPADAFFAVFFPVEILDSYLLVALGAGAKDLQALLSGEASSESQQRAWLQLGLLGLEMAVLAVLVVHLAGLASRAVERRREAVEGSDPGRHGEAALL